jgi:hypothetical protein
MYPAITPWTAAAAILAFGATGLWAWILIEGIEIVTDPMSTTMRRVRLAGAASFCALMLVGAYLCWTDQSGWAMASDELRSIQRT